MLKLPIWERMVLSRFTMQAFAIGSALSALLVILDFGLQASTLLREVGWTGIPLHYLLVISKRLPLLVSLSGVIACSLVAHQMVRHREWLALLAGGISHRRLLRPFLVMGLLQGLLLAANAQWLQPLAVDRLDALEGARNLHLSQLDHQTTLVCHRARGTRLEQNFWICPDRIEWADQYDTRSGRAERWIALERDGDGWHRSTSSDLVVAKRTPLQPRWQSAPWAETQPLSRLLQASVEVQVSSKRLATGLQRLLGCLLPLLGMLVVLPAILVYQRESRWVGPLVMGIASVLVGMTLLESASVVVGLGALSSWLGFGLPTLGVSLGLGWRWARWQT
jgi:lipopolysaccharide export LptBFGC system permease protein LptF